MIYRCDLVPQYQKFEKEILEATKRVFSTGRYILADELAAFEREFAAYLKVDHCIGNANATDGLILALKVLSVGAGDEVITTPYTAIPTLSAILAAGATPVFVDIDPKTFLIDLNKIPEAITPKTKAIMPVHIFGNVVDVEKLKKILPRPIPIIEDAAQAHGASIEGKFAGTLGDMGIFSFYPTKNLGANGDGGAVVTNNKSFFDQLKLKRNYGFINKDETITRGVNTRLDEVQAAILRIKLPYLDEMNSARQVIADKYYKHLPSSLFEFQKIEQGTISCHHVFVARFKGDRAAFTEYLDANGIQTNIYYKIPLYRQVALKEIEFSPKTLPHVEKLCQEAIALPMYPELPKDKLDFIIDKICSWKN